MKKFLCILLFFPLSAFAIDNVLVWDPSAGADSYSVSRKSESCGSPSVSWVGIATGLTEVTFTDLDVQNPWDACYRVTAVNESGESPPSDEAGKVPGKPVGLQVQ